MDQARVILALEEMLKYGSDLRQMHRMTFIFTFPTEEQAKQAAVLLQNKEGVESEVYILPPPWWKALFTRPQWQIYGSRILAPERDEIYRLTDIFNAIAKKCGGSYDRWEAKLVR